MTAAEARKLTKREFGPNPRTVAGIRACWEDAIHKAAAEGRASVMDREVGVMRTVTTDAEHEAALEALRKDGFRIQRISANGNTCVEVSWD